MCDLGINFVCMFINRIIKYRIKLIVILLEYTNAELYFFVSMVQY